MALFGVSTATFCFNGQCEPIVSTIINEISNFLNIIDNEGESSRQNSPCSKVTKDPRYILSEKRNGEEYIIEVRKKGRKVKTGLTAKQYASCQYKRFKNSPDNSNPDIESSTDRINVLCTATRQVAYKFKEVIVTKVHIVKGIYIDGGEYSTGLKPKEFVFCMLKKAVYIPYDELINIIPKEEEKPKIDILNSTVFQIVGTIAHPFAQLIQTTNNGIPLIVGVLPNGTQVNTQLTPQKFAEKFPGKYTTPITFMAPKENAIVQQLFGLVPVLTHPFAKLAVVVKNNVPSIIGIYPNGTNVNTGLTPEDFFQRFPVIYKPKDDNSTISKPQNTVAPNQNKRVVAVIDHPFENICTVNRNGIPIVMGIQKNGTTVETGLSQFEFADSFPIKYVPYTDYTQKCSKMTAKNCDRLLAGVLAHPYSHISVSERKGIPYIVGFKKNGNKTDTELSPKEFSNTYATKYIPLDELCSNVRENKVYDNTKKQKPPQTATLLLHPYAKLKVVFRMRIPIIIGVFANNTNVDTGLSLKQFITGYPKSFCPYDQYKANPRKPAKAVIINPKPSDRLMAVSSHPYTRILIINSNGSEVVCGIKSNGEFVNTYLPISQFQRKYPIRYVPFSVRIMNPFAYLFGSAAVAMSNPICPLLSIVAHPYYQIKVRITNNLLGIIGIFLNGTTVNTGLTPSAFAFSFPIKYILAPPPKPAVQPVNVIPPVPKPAPSRPAISTSIQIGGGGQHTIAINGKVVHSGSGGVNANINNGKLTIN